MDTNYINPLTIEEEYVKKAYSAFATEFDKRRFGKWTPSSEFIFSLPKFSLVLDAGCGNGRNMLLRKDIRMIGFDGCKELVEICHKKNLDVFECDVRHIQMRDNAVDATFCIAVIGHIYSFEERLTAINELLRVTKVGGSIFIQCWNIEAAQTCAKESKFIPLERKGDFLVTWGETKIKRYYHLFDEQELTELIGKINCSVMKIFNHHSGVGCIIKKI